MIWLDGLAGRIARDVDARAEVAGVRALQRRDRAKGRARRAWTFGQFLHHLAELHEVHERRRRRIERYLKELRPLPGEKTLATSTHPNPRLPRQGGEDHCRRSAKRASSSAASNSSCVRAAGPNWAKTHSGVRRRLRADPAWPPRGLHPRRSRSSSACSPPSADLRLEEGARHARRVRRGDPGATSGTSSRAARRWRSSSRSSPSATSAGAMIITSNLVFSEWGRIFKDPMTTAAAIDAPGAPLGDPRDDAGTSVRADAPPSGRKKEGATTNTEPTTTRGKKSANAVERGRWGRCNCR